MDSGDQTGILKAISPVPSLPTDVSAFPTDVLHTVTIVRCTLRHLPHPGLAWSSYAITFWH